MQSLKKISPQTIFILMCGSCHFDKASHDEFSVEFLMFVLIFFQPTLKIRSERSPIQSKSSRLGHLEGAPNFKTWSQLKKHSNNKYSKFDTKNVI